MTEPAAEPDTMSDLEALFWAVERDPLLASCFANLTLLDRPADLPRLRERMAQAAEAVPRLRQRVVPAAGGLAPPQWHDDPTFDVGRHVRHVELERGSLSELHQLVADACAAPLPRDRPLWEFLVVDGLPDGRGAMVQKLHHAITDGEGGIRLSTSFIDLERHPERAPARGGSGPRPSQDRSGGGAGAPDRAAQALRAARRPLDLAGRAAGAVATAVRHPTEWPARGAAAAATTSSLLRQAQVTTGRRSPLWLERSLSRRFTAFELSLEEVRDAAHRLGGSVNDLFVTGAAAAVGAYHAELGAPVDELRMAMPVSLRQKGDRSVVGNVFSPTQALVPTGPMDPVERFRLVNQRLAVTKGEPGLGAVGGVAAAASLLPPPVLAWAGRRLMSGVDFTTSNVRAAPFDVFLAGALVEANYPVGPLAGTAANLTTMSYRGTLFCGLHCDAAAVSEPERLRALMEDAYAELLEAAA